MKVCIIGDGLTSLALAKALVNHNIFVEIVSDKKKQIIDQSRSIGITKSNVEYFNKNIINIDQITWKINKIKIYSEKIKQNTLLEFHNNKLELFSMVRNLSLYNILDKSLKESKFFKKRKQKRLINIEKNYDLLINTNFNNLISKKFFSKKFTKKYKSFAYVAILKHEKINNNIARQIFTKIGPLAFLPISNTETSIVYSIKNSANVKKENLIELVKLHNSNYKIKEIKKISSFELLSMNLRRYYYKNILAFGELTHKIHPLAGQGFNMIIRDIKTLFTIIKRKSDLGMPLDISVNKEFEKETKSKNYIFSNGIDLIYELFNVESKLSNDFLSKSIQFFGKNPKLNKVFIKMADKGSIF